MFYPRLIVSLLLVSTFLTSSLKASDPLSLPSDPLVGRLVFERKGCISCHAVLGKGAYIGPDLGREHFYGDFLELGRVMWNHSPVMTDQMRAMLKSRPSFTVPEIRDLFFYLAYLRYLGEFGDQEVGKRLFKQKHCLDCHDQNGNAQGAASLSVVAANASPIKLAQAMWNHGPEMDRQMKAMGLSRPQFKGEEVSHLAAYLRSMIDVESGRKALMNPGNPLAGKETFKAKGCIECHSVGTAGATLAPDLERALLHRSVTEIAGIMWNHGPQMWEALGTQSKRVVFENDEMADVIAYLYFAGFLTVEGDSKKGASLFTEKGCTVCHDDSDNGDSVPDLRVSREITNPFDMVQMMWNHAPQMQKMMNDLNMSWPELDEGEMSDLYQYIRSLQKP